MSSADLLGAFIGFVLTLSVFSYLLGDNVLFRLVIHVFIGVAAAYVTVMAWYNVIKPQLVAPLLSGNLDWLILVVFLLSILLLTKTVPKFSIIGGPVMAYLVGVGAAAAIGGAIIGTLFPQVGGTVNSFDLGVSAQSGGGVLDMFGQMINGGIILVGALSTLIYFHFGVRLNSGLVEKRPAWMEVISWVGQGFIAIAFGALFAGVYSAALTAMIERLSFLVDFIFSFIFQVI